VKRLAGSAAVWLGWWCVAAPLWLLYAGEWDAYQWVAAAAAGAVAATAGLVVCELGLLRFRPEWRALAQAKRVPLQVFVDFWILAKALVCALVLRRPPRGLFRAKALAAGGEDEPADAFR
jgi:hypothetical protein